MTLRDRWQIFSAAPHRMLMFGGAVQFLASMAYWLVELTGRYTSLWDPLRTTVPGIHAHSFLMLYGLFPFFIFGFLMTTYPRWMGVGEVVRARYVATFLLMAAGGLLFHAGLYLGRPLVVTGIAVFLLGYLVGTTALWQVYRAARGRDRRYESILNVALAAGAVGLALFALGLGLGRGEWLHRAQSVGTWWFLGVVLVTVSHRMLPFFTSCVEGTPPVRQPRFGLALLVGGVALHGLLELAGSERWTWAVDLPLAGVAAYHLWGWGVRGSFRARLLAMLHVSFGWLVIALVLYGAGSLAWLASAQGALGRAPLHALGIGFIAGMTLAMATRVTLGHSGRELRADGFTWTLFWLLSGAAILRVIGELPWGAVVAGVGATWLAAVLLATVVALWVLRYGPIYLRPRADGRPG